MFELKSIFENIFEFEFVLHLKMGKWKSTPLPHFGPATSRPILASLSLFSHQPTFSPLFLPSPPQAQFAWPIFLFPAHGPFPSYMARFPRGLASPRWPISRAPLLMHVPASPRPSLVVGQDADHLGRKDKS